MFPILKYFSFSGTKILIAGGRPREIEDSISSYILEVYFNETSITKIEYKDLPNVPHSFIEAAFGSFKGRTLIMGGYSRYGRKCFELDQEEYKFIPSLNVNRWSAASTFIRNKVIVAGGWHTIETPSDTIEILYWDESNRGSQWIESPSRLPIAVARHTMVTLNNKLYLIGGWDGSDMLDTIWIGTLDSKDYEINWVQMELRLQKKRHAHFSFVISNQIIIFGGLDIEDDVVEIIEGDELKQGPTVPFTLYSWDDQAVLDRKNRIIITSAEAGLIVYDHQKGTFTPYDDLKIREERTRYAAILQ